MGTRSKICKIREKLVKEEEDKDKIEFKNLPIDELLLLILNTYQNIAWKILNMQI